MAKKSDYLCKNCDYNNNGWCNKKKFNGLKVIEQCEDKMVDGVLLAETEAIQKETEQSKVIKEKKTEIIETPGLKEEFDSMPYKNFGARELFFFIQQQLLAMKDSATVMEVKKVMLSLEKTLEIKEQLHGISIDGGIDSDIYESSKNISKIWEKKYGMLTEEDVKNSRK